MRPSKTARLVRLVAGTVIVGATPALAADSLASSVEQFLNNTQTKIEDTKVWKFHVRPSLRESAIWTDNIFLNDDHEQDLRLTRVTDTTTGDAITDPATLERIASRQRDFQNEKTQGRQSDYIFQSELGLDFVMPVNDEKSKAFKQDHLTILGVKVRDQQYLDHDELDNNSVFLHTDLFGFLTDLMNQEWGRNVWVRVKDDYSYLRDPLDTSIRLLRQDGITTVKNFNDFGRTENTFNVDGGINGPEADASIGYEHYNLWLSDHALDQAQHVRQNFHGVLGSLVPGGPEALRVFVRYDYTMYRFDDAPIRNAFGRVIRNEQILNDADVNKGTIGAEWRNEKIETLVEAAYENWKPLSGSGLSGDTSQFSGVVSHAQIAYRPWEERSTKFQLSFVQSIDYSAISNFNSNETATFSVLHEVIPNRLDGDFTVSFGTTNPSDGPYRKLFETGVGLTYHLYKQADLSLRYLFRHQTAHHEIVTNSDFQRGTTLYSYQVSSDSAFYQNIVELGLLLHF